MGLQFGYGITRLLDAHQRFVRAGYPVYLRLKNFTPVQNEMWAQLGYSIAPTGTAQTGTEDILIDPPPSVASISIHNIGMSAGKLRFGARRFLISQTFVSAQMQAQGLTAARMVWEGPNVLGLVTETLLFSIEDIKHQEVTGTTVSWTLTCNANELR